MIIPTDDLRIQHLRPLIPPAILMEELPIGARGSQTVSAARTAAEAIVRGDDDRLLVVVGPCSIHDVAAAREYGEGLRAEAERYADELLIVMRVYFEKPRTTVGWKGLINDPHLDGSFAINDGLRRARGLLVDLAESGLPVGCEFLDPISPQFVADLVSWGAIGARTTESQVHRELASGLSVPVGFKNGTDGNVQVAIDAIRAAARPHHFLSVTKQSVAAIVTTVGNDACHIILRGSTRGPNYDSQSIAKAQDVLASAGLRRGLMVDCSHGNSGKDPERQPAVADALAEQIAAGQRGIMGAMIESHLCGGRQDFRPGAELVYGQSITDACLGWDQTRPIFETLARAVRARRDR